MVLNLERGQDQQDSQDNKGRKQVAGQQLGFLSSDPVDPVNHV